PDPRADSSACRAYAPAGDGRSCPRGQRAPTRPSLRTWRGAPASQPELRGTGTVGKEGPALRGRAGSGGNGGRRAPETPEERPHLKQARLYDGQDGASHVAERRWG